MALREPPFEGSNDAGRIITGTANPNITAPANVADQQFYLQKNTGNGSYILWLKNGDTYEAVNKSNRLQGVFDRYSEGTVVSSFKPISNPSSSFSLDEGVDGRAFSVSSAGSISGSLDRSITISANPGTSGIALNSGTAYMESGDQYTVKLFNTTQTPVTISATNGSSTYTITGISYANYPTAFKSFNGTLWYFSINDSTNKDNAITFQAASQNGVSDAGGTSVTVASVTPFTGVTGIYPGFINDQVAFTPDLVGKTIALYGGQTRVVASVSNSTTLQWSTAFNVTGRINTFNIPALTTNSNVYSTASTFSSADIGKTVKIYYANNKTSRSLPNLASGPHMFFKIVSVSSDGSYATLDKPLACSGTFTMEIYKATINSQVSVFDAAGGGTISANGLYTPLTLPAGFTFKPTDVGNTMLFNPYGTFVSAQIIEFVSSTSVRVAYTGAGFSSSYSFMGSNKKILGQYGIHTISDASLSAGNTLNELILKFTGLSFLSGASNASLTTSPLYFGVGAASSTDAQSNSAVNGTFVIVDKQTRLMKLISGGYVANPTVVATGSLTYVSTDTVLFYYRDGTFTAKMVNSSGTTRETITYTPSVTPTLIPATIHCAAENILPATGSQTIGTGSKVFTMANTGTYAVGDLINLYPTTNTQAYVFGAITAVSANSSITVNCYSSSGSGTYSSWSARSNLETNIKMTVGAIGFLS